MNDVIFKRIMLQTRQDLKNFCYSVSSVPRNVSVKVKHDTYVVDGKSILGMFSLDLSNPVDVIFESVDWVNPEVINRAISRWEVEE